VGTHDFDEDADGKMIDVGMSVGSLLQLGAAALTCQWLCTHHGFFQL